ncbi:hypothetical protein [Microvirga massiliensis]|uniref:hypothetical protein n=1 Tax=Microvirga massiliensis TaxID=1033741 RepID=UPI00062B9662|nr:hypothetical protein [Microvirga massiliensis]
MIFPNSSSRVIRADTVAHPRDRSVAAILFVLLALVFAPVVGLHVAMAAFGPGQAASAEQGRAVPIAKPSTRLAHG